MSPVPRAPLEEGSEVGRTIGVFLVVSLLGGTILWFLNVFVLSRVKAAAIKAKLAPPDTDNTDIKALKKAVNDLQTEVEKCTRAVNGLAENITTMPKQGGGTGPSIRHASSESKKSV